MRKIICIFWVVIFVRLHATSQTPGQLLDNWSASAPIEKAYLHFDRDNYIAGETARFKAYLYSDYQPDTISTSLYAELLNDEGVVLSRSITPILLGTSGGYFEIPDTLSVGSYLIRAYTRTMLNQDPSYLYKRSIFIYGKKRANPVVVEKQLRLEFFPEGGNLVSNFSNSVAFKATNEQGLPTAVKGTLFNEKNEAIGSFSDFHDGMGQFDITPVPKAKYYVVAEGSSRQYNLPESVDKGIALVVLPHPQGSFFELKQRKDDPAFQVAYMIGQMQHHVVFRQDFANFKEELQGVINTQKLHSGILQITFFNKDHQPLAERLCFINNKEYIQPAELVADTINFQAKGRNRIYFQLKDTVRGNFSVSVSDAAFALRPRREENIFTGLLLTADLKGYVHNPAYYFSGDKDSVQTAVDLVMMTNGWRRFKWSEMAKQSNPAYRDGSFITLNGKINLRDTKKPFNSKPLLLMLIAADSTRRIQMINTDETGNFRLDSMLFFGKSKIFLSDIRGKKNTYIDIHFSDDTLTRNFQLPFLVKPPLYIPGKGQTEISSVTDQAYDALKRGKGLLLEGITLKTRKKTALQELDEKYARGMFAGGETKTLDLLNKDDAAGFISIFDYLQSRVPGISVVDNTYDSPSIEDVSSGPRIYYRQAGASVSAMGLIPMTIYLNEIETEASVVTALAPSEIAMIKVYSNFVGAAGNGAGGVLAIYTKKGSDITDLVRSTADMEPYNGYTVIKEFYEPDYAVDPSLLNKEDSRITLAWRPDILINNVNPKIPVTFYNSDRGKSYRIVIEGMTLDGKMLMIEKLIGTKGF